MVCMDGPPKYTESPENASERKGNCLLSEKGPIEPFGESGFWGMQGYRQHEDSPNAPVLLIHKVV